MQVKVVTIKETMQKELNSAIKKLEQENFKVVDIKVVSEQIFLILYKLVQSNNHYGYQKKQLVDPQSTTKPTTKQLNYLKTLMSKTGEQVDISNLSKRQAGILIGKLRKESKQSQDQSYQADQAEVEPDFKMDDLNKLDL